MAYGLNCGWAIGAFILPGEGPQVGQGAIGLVPISALTTFREPVSA